MAFWFLFLAFIGSTLLSELLRPKPQTQNAKAAGMGDFAFPTASAGRPVQVIFGRVRIEGPNVIDWGTFRAYPIMKSQTVKGLFTSDTVWSVVGYNYAIRMKLGLGHAGVTTLHKVWAGDKVAWTGTLAANVTTLNNINARGLFGGDDRGGGMWGTLMLKSASDAGFVGSRQLSCITWDGVIGTSTSLPAWSFEVSRYPAGLGRGEVGLDLNPMEIVYECLTDTKWGAGVPASKIDVASMQAVADILEAEGTGLSCVWDSRRTVGDFVGEVLKHADVVPHVDLQTGCFSFVAVRGGTDVATLLLLDESNCKLEAYARSAWDASTNEVKVTFNARARDYREDTAAAQDSANYTIQGRIESTTLQYSMCTTPALAAKLAFRDLRSLSYPLAKITLKAQRVAHTLYQGAMFRWSWRALGITDMAMRVTGVDFGTLTDGAITVDATQDVFAMGAAAFGDPPDSTWVDPITDPAALPFERVLEMPYQVGPMDSGFTGDPDDARLLTLGTRDAVASTLYYMAKTRTGTDAFAERGTLPAFTPSAALVAEYPEDTDYIDEVGLDVEAAVDFDLVASTTQVLLEGQLVNLAYLGNEAIAFRDLLDNEDGTYTLTGVYRGLLDTVPATHAAGARLWVGYAGQGTTQDTYTAGAIVSTKLVTATPKGVLDDDDAATLTTTIADRALRPYPPGDVKLNGVSWPSADITDPELVVTWAHRDRVAQAGAVEQGSASVGPESGQTYTLRIYGDAGVLKRTVTGLSGTTYTYAAADELADNDDEYNTGFRVELESVRAGLTSTYHHDRSCTFATRTP